MRKRQRRVTARTRALERNGRPDGDTRARGGNAHVDPILRPCLRIVALLRDPDDGSYQDASGCTGAAEAKSSEPPAAVTILAPARKAGDYAHRCADEEADARPLQCGAATGPEQPADDYPARRAQRDQAAVGAQLPVIKVQAHGTPDEETNARANQRALTTQAAAASCLEACDTVAGRARHRGSPGDREAEGGSVERLNGPHLLLNGRISRDGRNRDVESDRRLLRAAGAGSEKNDPGQQSRRA